MPVHRAGVSSPSKPLAATVGMVALLAAMLSCQGGDDSLQNGELSARRVTPLALLVAGDEQAAWALFDRDTASGWTPPVGARRVEVTANLDGSANLAALKVFGPSPYQLSLFDAQGQHLSGPHDLSALSEGWATFALKSSRYRPSAVILRFEPMGGGQAAVPEVELWGTAAALPLAWEPITLTGNEPIPTVLADEVPLASEAQAISRDPASALPACAAFSFDLRRHPASYRRAWLRYRTEGAFRPLVLTRVVNGGAATKGFWVPPASNEVGVFVHPVDAENLKLGRNQIEFCLPGEAHGTVRIGDATLVAELDHGSNIIEVLSIAPFDGIPTQGADDLLHGTGAPVTVSAGQELVVAFERWIAPDLVHVAAGADVTWSLRCVGANGAASDLPTSLVKDAASRTTYAISDAGHSRCAGLRLRPSVDTAVTQLRVFGSGTDRRIDFPRIVLASAREHFGHEAWVDGWARAPSRVRGGVRVSIDGKETDTTTGVFASLLRRTSSASDDWPVTITARFADGSTFTRQFVLDGKGGILPGGETRAPALDDGLTAEERRARFGDVGQVAEADVAPGAATRIALGTDVSVEIPATAMTGRKRVSLKHLSATEIPALDPGLINVTAPFKRAYEFKPHGEKFNDALKITMPYQASLIPQGYVPEDIQTFYYDETLKRWEPLARAQIVRGRQVVESLTDHFTIMINAIVVAPEHPQIASFDPNRLKGIKAATPAAGIQLIAPPEVNSRGEAALNYPLEIPPGRVGVQPSFRISYSSARGNGWLGLGWDLGASTIEAETRWGVPRYHPTLETETYLFDGAQLSPTAHRSEPRPRSQGTTRINGQQVKLYHPRVEGSFHRIARHGDGPGRYWWEVTDKKGTRYFYGGTPETGKVTSACLTDDEGNVFRWALKEIRDTHGNRVRFDHETVTWSAPGQVPGRDLYLASAHYTLRAGETTAPYRVVFLREAACTSEGQTGCRPDLIVSGRGGFKQVTSERLRRIEVYYRQTLVRAWELTYDQGPFGKSRLRRLTQFGVNNRLFHGNEHTFDYFDEVTGTGNEYIGFAQMPPWNAGSETPDIGVSLPGGFADSIGSADASALGGGKTKSAGGHLYLGIGFAASGKELSVGVKAGRRSDVTNGKVALVDVDGDGLADRVFRSANGGFYFNRNLSGPVGPPQFAALALPVEGLPALSRERSTMRLSIGPEAYVKPVQFHANKAFSSSEQDTYLSDVNSDGFVDLVQGSMVYFNRLKGDGLPLFIPRDSSGTPVPIGTSVVAVDVLPPSFEDPALEAQLDSESPPVDVVRSWQAPYPGRVRISGEVRLAQVQRTGADGLRTTIEREGQQLWSHEFGPTELQPQQPVLETDVAAGDHILFRLHALRNEWDDRVNWWPIIQYVDRAPAHDENLLSMHRFIGLEDFSLAGRADTGMNVPFAGTLRLTGKLSKLRETSDDVSVMIMVDGRAVFSQVLPAAAQTTLALEQDITVNARSFVALRIHTDSSIDLTALAFEPVPTGDGSLRHGPWLRYVSARGEDGRSLPVEDHNGKPIFDIPLTYDLTTYSLRTPAVPAPAYMPSTTRTLNVLARVEATRTPQKGTVTFTAKSRGRLLGKRQVTIENTGTSVMSLDVPVVADEPVFFSFSVSNADLFSSIQTVALSGTNLLPTIRYGVAGQGRLSHAYRGWAYGGYNGAGARGDQPIPPGELNRMPIFDGSEVPTEETAPDMARQFAAEGLQAFPFVPMPDKMPCRYTEEDPFACSRVEGGHWQGPHELIYVAAAEMSTSRIGGPVPRLPPPAQIAGAAAVPRISRSSNTAIGGGAVPVSFSRATGEAHGLLDYLDMNGDSFPDVVSPERIQYSSPLGVLAERRDVPSRDLRTTSTKNSTIGIGGNIAEAIANAKGRAGLSTKQQMQPIGFSLNVGASGGQSTSEADLMDVNGDGLPDRLWKGSGTLDVSLNLGYRFAAREPWGQAVINEGESEEQNGGASLSFNDGIYGFGGGVNGSLSSSRTRKAGGARCGGSLLDVNGDGLVDCAEQADDGLWVWFNQGHRMASAPVRWRGGISGHGMSLNQSTTLGGGVFFTIKIPIWVISLIINPGVDFGESASRPTVAIQDIDGDGYPDHLVSRSPNEISVARNRTGRTNLLRHVKRPLGAEIWLDYTRTGNTQDMPQSRWALSEVKVYDGLADSAELGQATDYTAQRVRYVNGRYDRYEREFYGFARVEVDTLDTRGWNGVIPTSALPVYRRQELNYLNDSYHTRGLQAASRALSGDGAVFGRTIYEYELRDVYSGRVLTPPQAVRTEAVFPALVQEHHYQHEGDPNTFIHTFTTQNYDLYGNITALYDAGGPGGGDDYRAEIHYTAQSSSCRTHYIVGVADSIIVRDANGSLLRKREATVDCTNGAGDLRQIRVALDSSAVAQTDLSYDTDGNLISVISPPNQNAQRYQLIYSYDPEVKSHVVRMDDSFGYYSTADYDLRFGAPTAETDVNGNSVLTEYDDFGRTVRIRGPYEIARGLNYAMRFIYRPDAMVPFATTAHMDVFRNVADPIETVTLADGLGRNIQVKKDATLHRGVGATAQDAMIVSGRMHFDPWGRLVEKWYPTEEPKSTALNQTFTRPADASAPPTRITYDVLDRETKTVMPDDARTLTSYSLEPALSGGGLWALTTTIDAEDNRGDAYLDARANIRAVVEYLDGRGITTRYEYDPLKQIRRVLDAAGNVTRSDYDLAGRRTHVVHPDSGHTEFVHDAAGNLIRKITANLRREGGAIEYRYDFTHLIGIRYPRFSDNNVTYVWGGASLRSQGGNRVGRIVRVDDNSGFEERRYGALGEVVYERRSIDSHTMGNSPNSPEIYVTHYLYDTWGRLQQMIYPDTEVLTYAYDSGGQVRAVSGLKLGIQFPYLTRLEYDRFEQRRFQQTGNGIRSYYNYDSLSRRIAKLEAGEFQRFTYGYDKAGNVTNLVNEVPNARPNEYGGRVEQNFIYDDLYRVTSATGTWFQPPGKLNQYAYTLQYDDIHNIRAKNQQHWIRNRGDSKPIPQHKTTYAWNYEYGSAKPHAATHIGDRTFFYDDNGNQTGWDHDRSGQRRMIVWDEESRIRSISDNGRTTRFVYDAGGDRVIKTGAQGETVYVNDKWTVRNRSVGTKHVYVGTARIASKLSPGDAHVRPGESDLVSMMLGKWWEHRSKNGHESGRNVEMNPHYQVPSEMPDDGMPDTNFLYIYHSDHVGSTSYVTDVDGELYEHVQYFPSGETWVDQRSNTERLPYLFSGKELDQETGLYYFGARYYDPRIGLWAGADPASTEYLDGQAGLGGVYLPINLATYAYAGHNPRKYSDPDGRALNLVAAAVGAVGGAVIGGGVELGRQLWRGEDVNWKRVGASSAGGAVAGGLAGLTAGASLVAQGTMAAAASVAGGTVTRTALGEKTTGTDVLVDAGVGLLTFGIVKGGSAAWQRIRAPGTLTASQGYVNLASQQRTKHILTGDATGGGHLWPGAPGKTPFPKGWSGDKIMHNASDIATDPSLTWLQQTGKPGSLFTNAGKPARFTVIGEREGVRIKVVIEPAGEGIITAHPVQ